MSSKNIRAEAALERISERELLEVNGGYYHAWAIDVWVDAGCPNDFMARPSPDGLEAEGAVRSSVLE